MVKIIILIWENCDFASSIIFYSSEFTESANTLKEWMHGVLN